MREDATRKPLEIVRIQQTEGYASPRIRCYGPISCVVAHEATVQRVFPAIFVFGDVICRCPRRGKGEGSVLDSVGISSDDRSEICVICLGINEVLLASSRLVFDGREEIIYTMDVRWGSS